MLIDRHVCGPALLGVVFLSAVLAAQTGELPVRGLHLAAPKTDEIVLATRFIREALPEEGVNVLVLEFDYGYQFTRRPEVAAEGALSRADVAEIVAACRAAGVRLIPQINLLGHQSWKEKTGELLLAHPEFDETPGKYPNNEGIYCRSYCPLHPRVHEVMFDLIDEIVDACDADAFHAGMDEVFLIADPDCPRCAGKDPAGLFAGEVRAIRDHLNKNSRELWIWGDRLLDGETTGINKWEASRNNTQAAIDEIPRDVVICDWHYNRAEPTAAWFAMHGFPVVSSPWRKPGVALSQLRQIRAVRENATPETAERMRGVLQTTWCGAGPFIRAYNGEDVDSRAAIESALCFRELFREMRNTGLAPANK